MSLVLQRLNNRSSRVYRLWPAAVLLLAIVGISLLATFVTAGPTTLAGIDATRLMVFLISFAAGVVWWAVYLWLFAHLCGSTWMDALNRSALPAALLSISLLPDLAVLLSGKLPYSLSFDSQLRAVYVWTGCLLVFIAFFIQQLVLAWHISHVDGSNRIHAPEARTEVIRSWIVWLQASARILLRDRALLSILVVGILLRLAVVDEFQGGDMNDTLNVANSLLNWPPFLYYHDYRPETYVYNHLPLFPILVAPTFWLFRNLIELPLWLAVKLTSAGADVIVALLIYRFARNGWTRRLRVLLAAAWFLSPLVVGADDHATGLAAMFAVAAFASVRRGWVCGAMIALAIATRTEAAFLALPLAVHFIFKRELVEKAAFFGALATVTAVLAGPFILTDPGALYYAMLLQGERQTVGELSVLLMFLRPHLPADLISFFLRNPTLLMGVVALSASLLALRDNRPLRVALVVALGYLITIPVLHPRYAELAYALGLLYAAYYRSAFTAIAVVPATWPWMTGGLAFEAGLGMALAAAGLARPTAPRGGSTGKGDGTAAATGQESGQPTTPAREPGPLETRGERSPV